MCIDTIPLKDPLQKGNNTQWLQVLDVIVFKYTSHPYDISISVIPIASSNKKLLVTKGIATRSKDATRGSWHRY